MRRRPSPFVFGLALLCASCAEIINGREQRVPVTSTPLGATVFVNGVREGVTPLNLDLHRKHKGPVIRVESPGYDPVVIRVIRRTEVFPILGNILWGLLPGSLPAGIYAAGHEGAGFFPAWVKWACAFGAVFTALDAGTGSINTFDPREIVIPLKRSDGPPRVETILIEEGAFRNVKWIRIAG